MSYNIQITQRFQKEAKRLLKKYASLKTELTELKISLLKNPTQGTPLGNNCFKIRLPIKSKGKGKSGGSRIITHVVVVKKDIYLLTIYDKSEKKSVSNKELSILLKNAAIK